MREETNHAITTTADDSAVVEPVVVNPIEQDSPAPAMSSPVENIDNGVDHDDDDNVTIILLDSDSPNQGISMDWIEQQGPEMEQRRRAVLLRELKRVQRSSFIHFAILCFIPTIFLAIVIATVIAGEEECTSDVTYCELEPR
jgi:hypothetical protein